LNEENVSAKRIGAKAEAWLSHSHGLLRGSPGIVKEEGEGAKTPFCIELGRAHAASQEETGLCADR
jgi:hypothetical protein